MDEELLHTIFKNYEAIITIENGTIIGGFGASVLAFANTNTYKQTIVTLGIEDKFIEHGSTDQLKQLQKLDVLSVKKRIEDLLFVLNNR